MYIYIYLYKFPYPRWQQASTMPPLASPRHDLLQTRLLRSTRRTFKVGTPTFVSHRRHSSRLEGTGSSTRQGLPGSKAYIILFSIRVIRSACASDSILAAGTLRAVFRMEQCILVPSLHGPRQQLPLVSLPTTTGGTTEPSKFRCSLQALG